MLTKIEQMQSLLTLRPQLWTRAPEEQTDELPLSCMTLNNKETCRLGFEFVLPHSDPILLTLILRIEYGLAHLRSIKQVG